MTKLCARGKAAAKRKFKVYTSDYANAYASKICAGKIKDPSGVKRKDFKGPKPAKIGGEMKVQKAGLGLLMASQKKNRRKVRNVMKDKNLQMFAPGLYAMSNLKGGGMSEPESTGSYIQQDIDGDESFTNPSTQAYYKGMLD